MLETGAGIAVFSGAPEARLGARRRPVPCGILRHFTHLHTAAVRAGLRAMAIASAHLSGSQLSRSVR
jgi:hypothetical protein